MISYVDEQQIIASQNEIREGKFQLGKLVLKFKQMFEWINILLGTEYNHRYINIVLKSRLMIDKA